MSKSLALAGSASTVQITVKKKTTQKAYINDLSNLIVYIMYKSGAHIKLNGNVDDISTVKTL